MARAVTSLTGTSSAFVCLKFVVFVELFVEVFTADKKYFIDAANIITASVEVFTTLHVRLYTGGNTPNCTWNLCHFGKLTFWNKKRYILDELTCNYIIRCSQRGDWTFSAVTETLRFINVLYCHCFTIWRYTQLFNFKMFHQKASVETIKVVLQFDANFNQINGKVCCMLHQNFPAAAGITLKFDNDSPPSNYL